MDLCKPALNSNVKHETIYNTLKKIKTENGSINSLPLKTSPLKKSPNKENLFQVKTSPKKNLKAVLEDPINCGVNVDDAIAMKKEAPLASLPSIENKVPNHASAERINKSCILENGDKPKGCRQKVVTPKESPDKNNVKITSPKKSPLSGM